MRVTDTAAAVARVDGYFAADWAQPRPRRRGARRATAKVEARRQSRELHRARALAAEPPRPESRGRLIRGLKLKLYAFPRDLVLNEKVAEKILEASGFLRYETVPSV